MHLDDSSLPEFLESLELRAPGEVVAMLSAGDGNINYVRRVQVGDRRLVVKQARDALERFPEYRVTTDRILFERRYGEVVAELAPQVAGVLPGVIRFDLESRVLILEDLGEGPRLDHELEAGRVPEDALHALGRFLGAVHSATAPVAKALAAEFANDEMRSLHGEHIFTLPYEAGNPFALSPTLFAVSTTLLSEPLRERIAALRTGYYESRGALVHADPQPGNVLLQGAQPRLIDAEIAHVGDPAFDLGTALAHLEIRVPLTSDPGALRAGAKALAAGYTSAGGSEADAERARAYAGVEILRRTLGAARLDCVADDDSATAALDHARVLIDSVHP